MECCLGVGHFNLHYDFLVEDDNDLKDMLHKVDEILGDGIWEIYEVEVGGGISWGEGIRIAFLDLEDCYCILATSCGNINKSKL